MKTRRSPEQAIVDGIAFALLEKVGCVAYREAVERHGSAADALRAHPDAQARGEARRQAEAILQRARALGVTVLVQAESGYPPALMDLRDPPPVVYALGDTTLLARRCVGIVGTRHASQSGERTAHQMAARFVNAGLVVVSGMAFGIDAAAHRGALDNGGGTIAVLGGGVDLPYPPSHAALHERMVANGVVISEALIGTRPVPGAFPRRNRIIAALSETLFVIEAGDRSGALITSRLALELGRNVGAVPGPIDSPRHVGSNRLLAQGASFVGSIDDALSIADVTHVAPPENAPIEEKSDGNAPDPASQKILNALRTGATDLDDLARSTLLSPREFANALAMLELRGELVINDGATVSLQAS